MKARIILVDDEKNFLNALQRSLAEQYQVTTATSGLEAIALVKENGPFAVIISDLKMPGMDGIDLLARMKELAPNTARIMLTGYPQQKILRDAIDQGLIYQFLTKPTSFQELNKAIEKGVLYYQAAL